MYGRWWTKNLNYCVRRGVDWQAWVLFVPLTHAHAHDDHRTRCTQGMLVEGWKDSEGVDLWEYTWRQTARTAPSITPQSIRS